MFTECRHILPSGLKCKSPALRNRPFCYFHSGLRRYSSDGTSNRKEPLILPSLEDLSGVQIAIMEVLNAFGHGRIDRHQAGLYLYGLQIATQIATRTPTHENPSVVRSITCDSYGEDLAEEENTCEPPHDCLTCTTRDTCKNFEDYEKEVEELEEQLAEQEEEKEEEAQEDEDDSEDEESEEDLEHDHEEDLEEEDFEATDGEASDHDENQDLACVDPEDDEDALIRKAMRLLKPAPNAHRT